MKASRQKGSILIYILIAIFLTGLLVAAMTQGTKKSASSEQVNEMMLYIMQDIKTIHSAVTECVQDYSADVTSGANPNIPFPLYCANNACALGGMTSAGAGVAVTLMGCPGAPSTQNLMFNTNTGHTFNSFKVLGDTTNYTTTYFSNATDGVYLRITRAVSDPVWTEVISRLTTKYSQCSSIVESINPDPTGFNCSGGCFYYFILRKASGPVFPACP